MYRPLRVLSVTPETDEINIYELVDMDGAELPAFEAGAHIEIGLTEKIVRQYSLCNDPRERHRYVIAVKFDKQGRGGSRFVHEEIGVGAILRNWKLRNSFCLDETAANYILVAGGVGITPIMSMMARLKYLGRRFTLHYCARSEAKAAFRDSLLGGEYASQVMFHYSEKEASRQWQLSDALAVAEPGTQIYCCGPAGLVAGVKDATTLWSAGTVHFEFFSAASSLSPQTDETFSVKAARGGDVYSIPPDKTILQVLREHRVYVESACEAGACGTCRVRYIDGMPDHRDMYLTEGERSEFVMVCVSRSKTSCLTLDL
jgi:ferredoxin-NADP reductase